MHLRGTAGIFVLSCLLAAAWAPSALGAASGTINGGSFDSSGTVITVSNLTVTNTSCGSSNGGLLYQECGGTAGLMPASQGECPPYDEKATLPAGLIPMWNSAYRATPGDSSSGQVSASVPERAAYRICLYSKHFNQVATSGGVQEGQDSFLVASSVVAAPPDLPVLTEGQAVAAVTRALKVEFGKKFSSGTGRKVRCVEQSEGEFACRVKWRRKNSSYKGKATVAGAPDDPVVELNVKKKALAK